MLSIVFYGMQLFIHVLAMLTSTDVELTHRWILTH